MNERQYIVSDTSAWEDLLDECISIVDHTHDPAAQILGLVVSHLHTPESLRDGSLVNELNGYALPDHLRENITRKALTLYVNLFNELHAAFSQRAKSYYLITTRGCIRIGMFY